ncbi:MAG: zinc ribbon domain-containing protein [Ignavibacteria bacterium]|jgi:putative FmdB family regulatory protein|nr:zinc ribbon domain-containing protein [Ignavibacteria bacterium]MDP3829752.1 zinc ribbon domain-containing protein [Ignavibacteriaceae bacterium]
MPIFEYRCLDCNSKFEILHKTTQNSEDATCPKCNTKNIKKLISSFSAKIPATISYSYDDTCSSGNCSVNSQSPCSSGMCGLN